nr:MAG TPA: terminase small subunit [Caudoviricetes sp.]
MPHPKTDKPKGRPPVRDLIMKNLERIGKLRRQGLTEEQVAVAIGVGKSTFKDYKNTIPELREVLEKSKEKLIEDLEDSLYRRALGLCKITTTKKFIEEVNGVKKQKIEETTQNCVPDVGALVFALKNLSPQKWRDNPDFSFADLENKLKNMKSFSEKAEEMDKKLKNQVKEESPL